MEITWTHEEGTTVWEDVREVDVDEWITRSVLDYGFYKDITKETDSLFSLVLQGNMDTLFCIDVDKSFNLHYYIGYLKS
jgi:hypothetical protein